LSSEPTKRHNFLLTAPCLLGHQHRPQANNFLLVSPQTSSVKSWFFLFNSIKVAGTGDFILET
jgi:hypothetical protein